MSDFQLKIKLENRLKPKLRTFFRNIALEVQASLVSRGRVPDLSYHNRDMAALLREHYRAVSKSFRGRVSSQLKKHYPVILEIKQAEEDIEAMINEDNKKRSEEQARLIMDTTEDQLKAILAATAIAAATSGRNSNVEIADQVRKEFIASNGNRVDTIAMTETNGVAEQVKETEARVTLGAMVAAGLAAAKAFKIWDANLDEKTRLWHAEADLQKVRVFEPFIVKGQKLMRPGDTSLGATLDNIINCRCSARYTIL